MSDTENKETLTVVAEQAEGGSPADQALVEEMARAGVLYGRKKSKTHPRMAKFIFATRNGFEILDLMKTMANIAEAKEFIKGIKEKSGTVLLVGTQPAAIGFIEQFAKKLNYPFVIERWLGGTLTNFQTIFKRIQYLIKLKADRAGGRLEKYTKKERVGFDREIARLEHLMGGLEIMSKLPDAVFVVDAHVHNLAVHEANIMKIPVIAVINTDNNPDNVQYAIPGNTAAQSSLQWILGKLFE